MDKEDIRAQIREYYDETLQDNGDLRTNACCCSATAPPKYVLDVLRDIDDEIVERFYGCGSPIPVALEGATVLDLGCGTGRDVFVAAKLVGESGHVIGVDMTPSQIELAQKHVDSQLQRLGLSCNNVSFIQGYIEDMQDIADESVDVVISNCVINLSPFKDELFHEIFRVLKPGGELYFSDIFSDRRVPEDFAKDPVLSGECIAGAMYIEDFRRLLAECGVNAFYAVEREDIEVGDFSISTKLGCIGFKSLTVRAIKSSNLEVGEENYGQIATYLGTIPENTRYFDLSEDVRLVRGRPVAISGNMALFLQESRYAPHFNITPRATHLGPFDFRAANEALAIRNGREWVDLHMLEKTSEELGIEPFSQRVHDRGLLKTSEMVTMQVNVGYKCNLSCTHCFLECGPQRFEMMTRETMEDVLAAFKSGGYKTLDITGGAPEMNPETEWLIDEGSKIADEVLVRTNLCILDMPEYAHFKDVYARNKVKLVASLPYFEEEECDGQRGNGVFKRTISILRELNEIGYGRNPQLQIDLVYNVDGPFLPPDQSELEDFYRYELKKTEGVDFNGLYALGNYNLGRFASRLKTQGKFDYYLKLLADNYNAAVVAHIMCRTQVDVDWNGMLYDCEANHVLKLGIKGETGPLSVHDIIDAPLQRRHISTSPICYSCSAGCGSSCGGSLMDKYA